MEHLHLPVVGLQLRWHPHQQTLKPGLAVVLLTVADLYIIQQLTELHMQLIQQLQVCVVR
jgi:hypothetical protein